MTIPGTHGGTDAALSASSARGALLLRPPAPIGGRRVRRPLASGRGAAGLLLAAAASLAAWTPSRPAAAEILVLKDGKRVNCRVLAMDETQVTVRTAGGSERTVPKGEIASIDPSVSPVEIYEAAAEAASAEGGALAFYVGLWSVEVDSDRRADAKTAFLVAARDPDWAGRAYHQLALLAQTPEEKRQYLLRAALADASLAAAVEEELGSREGAGEIPRETLLALADAILMIAQGNAPSAASRLAQLESTADRSAIDMLSRRLSQSTGHTIASLRALAGGGASKDSRAEAASPKGGPCATCGGIGYVTCHVCRGRGFVQCSTCKGDGVIRTRTRTSHGGVRTTSQTCPSCKGSGVKDCVVCLRWPEGAITENRTINIPEPCATCNGTGKVATTSSTGAATLLGTGTTTTNERPCPACRGTGSTSRPLAVSASITASGIRRCAKCNEDGHIPFAFSSRQQAQESALAAGAEAASLASDETIAQLVEFANLAKLAAEGKAEFRWRSGTKVPLYQDFAPTAEDAADPVVFACGKWLPQSKAKSALSRAKTLQHKPRPVDLAPFEEWIADREMDYLRKHSLPVGLGANPAAECLALAALYERNQEVGASSALDRMQVYKTTFFPAPKTEGQETVCRWRFAGAASVPEIAFVMLKRPASWPAIEIRMVRSPLGGLDLAKVAAAIAAEPRFQSSPITLYYRVRSCTRTGELREDGACVQIALGVSVCAVACGPEDKPSRVWTQAGLKLPRVER